MYRYTSRRGAAFSIRRERPLKNALHSLGFGDVSSVHIGRHIVIETDSESPDGAVASVTAMCERLLANPVIEDFEIESATAA